MSLYKDIKIYTQLAYAMDNYNNWDFFESRNPLSCFSSMFASQCWEQRIIYVQSVAEEFAAIPLGTLT